MTQQPVPLDVQYPEKLSRLWAVAKILLGWIYVGIPHGLFLLFDGIAVWVVTVAALFAILFTSKYPRGMFDFVVGYRRWQLRVNAYMGLLRDEYPPFSGKP